ncbi:hypothetical protein CDAR_248221 [Caerostris darwini]|uniref:RNase III domain-containing protein n=1 Tax=Caerostris darwini TaxID=1538125 RepID=A0AAV4VL42_9ARAC|nr:hypothetical protein CDAR_248221 [Caerostris darwini]
MSKCNDMTERQKMAIVYWQRLIPYTDEYNLTIVFKTYDDLHLRLMVTFTLHPTQPYTILAEWIQVKKAILPPVYSHVDILACRLQTLFPAMCGEPLGSLSRADRFYEALGAYSKTHTEPTPSLILQVLIAISAGDEFNLDHLKIIVDSFLKYAISAKTYMKYPLFDEDANTLQLPLNLSSRNNQAKESPRQGQLMILEWRTRSL